MDQLVVDLLELSTVSRTEVARTDFDLGDVAREVLDGLRRGKPQRALET